MKKQRNIISILTVWLAVLLLPFFLLSSCADILDFDEKPILLSASSKTVETRASSNIQSRAFDSGETVSVYITGSSSTFSEYAIGNPAYCITSEPINGVNTLTPTDGILYFPSGMNSVANIWAVYPSTVTSSSTTFTVAQDQSDESDYKNSDLIYVSPFSQGKTSNTISMPFVHQMAKLTITAFPGDGCTVDNVITIKGVKRVVNITPGQENILSTDGSGNYSVTWGPGGSDESLTIENGGSILFPPQTVTSANFITVTGTYTENGQVKTGTATFDITSKTFESGKEYNLSMAIGADNFMDGVQITGWSSAYGDFTLTPSGGRDPIRISDIASQSYIGSAIEPTPVVTYGTVSPKTLINGSDYTLNYVDNVNVGRGQVLVIGKNYYAGLAGVKEFYITSVPGNISYETTALTVGYTIGGTVTNSLTKVGDGKVTYTSSNPSVATVDEETGEVSIWNEGTTVVTATVADGVNYTYSTKTASYTLTVTKRAVSNFNITYSPTSFTYDGTTKQMSHVTVNDGDNVLVYGKDYTYKLKNQAGTGDAVNAGTAVLTVTGLGNYSNESREFNITINKATPTITLSETGAMNVGVAGMEDMRLKTRHASTNSWVELSDFKCRSLNTAYAITSTAGGNEKTSMDALINCPINVKGIKETSTAVKVEVYVEGNDNYNSASASFDVNVLKAEWDFPYQGTLKGAGEGSDGKTQLWTCPADGYYLLEVWGASGGDVSSSSALNQMVGGYGAYVYGTVNLKNGDKLYVSAGGKGGCVPESKVPSDYDVNQCGGWNGGGRITTATTMARTSYSGGGGGATDIAVNGTENGTDWNTEEHLYSRIIVAGGGGGAYCYPGNLGTVNNEAGYNNGGSGGAWIGGQGKGPDWGYGGNLNSGGERGKRHKTQITNDGVFGKGGDYYHSEGGGAGGGGWYGGTGGSLSGGNASGSGGSSWAWSDQLSGLTVNPYGKSTDYASGTTVIDLDYGAKKAGTSGSYTRYADVGDQSKALSSYYPSSGSGITHKPNDRFKLTDVGVKRSVNSGHGYAKITRLNF